MTRRRGGSKNRHAGPEWIVGGTALEMLLSSQYAHSITHGWSACPPLCAAFLVVPYFRKMVECDL